MGITASYILELSNALKTSVLCYDYSGYGLATGKPSEANCYSDIRAAYSYLISERHVESSQILLFGRSLGSGPTIDLASELRCELGGVVLIAALTSCVRVVFSSALTMKFDMFVNIDKIPKVCVPIFCVHGMMDEVVPFIHGVHLSRRARFPLEPLWIRGAGHNNLESSRFQMDVFARYAAVLREFAQWSPPPPPPPMPEHTPSHNGGKGGSPTRRRESFGALAKAAVCFGVNVHKLGGGTKDNINNNNYNHNNNEMALDEGGRPIRRRLKQQQHAESAGRLFIDEDRKGSTGVSEEDLMIQQPRTLGRLLFSTTSGKVTKARSSAMEARRKVGQSLQMSSEHPVWGVNGVRRVSMPHCRSENGEAVAAAAAATAAAATASASACDHASLSKGCVNRCQIRCQTAIAL